MISRDLKAEILRLYHAEKWTVGTIAKQLGVHHTTVQRVLRYPDAVNSRIHPRASIIDPYLPFVLEALEKYPRLRASRLYGMVKERGYGGGPDHFRKLVARYRPRRPTEAYQRLRTLPGEEGQVDWAHFGKVTVGGATRVLWAFVMVLSYSRQIYLRFFYGNAMANFLRGHVAAFERFEGVPRVLLYDNLKSAVLERRGDAIRFNERLLEMSAHYRFEARPVAPARGNEKGRVERAIRYVRDSFFAARPWSDIDQLNEQAQQWASGPATDRRWPDDRNRTVQQAYEEERTTLLALPNDAFPTEDCLPVEIGKTPYARFDLNDYSVPSQYVRRTLVVRATLGTVRICDGQQVVAEHQRTFDRGQQVEDATHVEELAEFKKRARRHRGFDRLAKAAPSTQRFFEILAQRGVHLGSATARMLELLKRCAAEDLEAAVAESIARGTVHLGAVRQLVDQRRAARGKPPAIANHFASKKHEHIVVRPHPLKSYDELGDEVPNE